ncbi:MAG: hypothetical protein EZS28_007786, partial [Streblomastix strix]
GIEGQQFIFEQEEEEEEEEDVDIEQDNNQKEMIVDKTDENIDSKQEQEIEQQIPILEKSSEIEKLKDDSQQVQQQQQSKSISSRIVSTNTNRFNIPISPLFASPNINNPFNTSQQLQQQEKQYKSPNQSIWKQQKSMNKDQQQQQAEMKPFLHLRQRRTKLIHFVTEKPWVAIGSDWPDFWVWKQEARELCSVAKILHQQELYIERALESVSNAAQLNNEEVKGRGMIRLDIENKRRGNLQLGMRSINTWKEIWDWFTDLMLARTLKEEAGKQRKEKENAGRDEDEVLEGGIGVALRSPDMSKCVTLKEFLEANGKQYLSPNTLMKPAVARR